MAEQLPTARPELCSAKYSAEQIPGYVVVRASGFHQTSSYNVFFVQSPLDIFPPRFSLWHTFPTGIVLEVITPFTTTISFAAKQRIENITVVDAEGNHVVNVDAAPDRQIKHAAAFFQKDGPFPMRRDE